MAPYSRWVTATLGVVVLALAVTAIVAGVHLHDVNGKASARRAALAAGRSDLTRLVGLPAHPATSDYRAALGGATTSFQRSFQAPNNSVLRALTSGQVRSGATVAGMGLTDLHGSTAQLLATSIVNVDSVSREYRMALTVQRAGGTWLISNVKILQ